MFNKRKEKTKKIFYLSIATIEDNKSRAKIENNHKINFRLYSQMNFLKIQTKVKQNIYFHFVDENVQN